MKKILALCAVGLVMWASAAAAWPEGPSYSGKSEYVGVFDYGGAVRTSFEIRDGVAGDAAVAGSLDAFYMKRKIGVLAEIKPSSGAAAGVWFGALFDEWIFPHLGVDSRTLFDGPGVGASCGLMAIFGIPGTDETAGRIGIRGTYYGPDDEAGGWELSLILGGMAPVK
jgi:hypothetical protein